MLPPTDISARELFLKLIERPYPSEVVPFPRLDADGKPICNVRIRVLAFETHEQAQLRAEKRIRERYSPEEYAHAVSTDTLKQIIGDAVTAEILAEAVVAVDPEPGSEPPRYARLFRNADEVRSLTTDEVSILFSMYLMVQARFGPYESTFRSPEEIDAWVQRIEEGASAYPLALIGSRQRDELLCLLAGRVSCVLRLLASPRENWPTLLESLRTKWDAGMHSYSVRAADFAQFPISVEHAAQLSDTIRG